MIDPERPLTITADGAREQVEEHAVPRPDARRPRGADAARGPGGLRPRREARDDAPAGPPRSCSRTAACSAARASARRVESIGEVVFNTSITGYQEIVSDPSYAGQIVVMTATADRQRRRQPRRHRGDARSCAPASRSASCRRFRRAGAPRTTLPHWLDESGVPGIDGIDTRALTRVLRDEGAMRGAITPHVDRDRRRARARARGAEDGRPRSRPARHVRASATSGPSRPGARPTTAARCRRRRSRTTSSRTTSASRRTSFASCATSARASRSVPGVDAGARGARARRRRLLPVERPRRSGGRRLRRRRDEGADRDAASRCSASASATRSSASRSARKTLKLPFGHHGGNHPVLDKTTGKVEITSQNHGFVVDPATLPSGVHVTHENLFDHSNEGIAVDGQADLQRAVPPRGEPGPARRELPVRAVPRPAEKRAT